jgi:hypothetical protein
MLSVANQPFLLTVVMLTVIILSVLAPLKERMDIHLLKCPLLF